MSTLIWVSSSSGNAFMPGSTKPLPESMLNNHQWGFVAFTWRLFHRKCSTSIWVNIVLGNGLLPGNTMPLPEPVLTNHQWGPVAFTWGQFHRNWYEFENYYFKNRAASPRSYWVKYPMNSFMTEMQTMNKDDLLNKHYLNQCLLFIIGVLWHSPVSNFISAH